jgi:hypothetical protein
MDTFSELKKTLHKYEYCFDKKDKNTIVVSLLGLNKEAIKLNKNEVLVRVIKDYTGLLEKEEELISSNVDELINALVPVSIDFPDMSYIGILVYGDEFSVKEAVEYIKKYLENRGEEINFIKEKFNTLLNKENIDKEDLKIFQNYLILNNKNHK